MHPDTAAVRVSEAHEYIASFVAEHGEGDFADGVRQLSRNGGMSAPAREVRNAEALAAVVELLAATNPTKKSTTTRKGK